MGILTKILGDPNVKTIKSLQKIVDQINGLEEKFSSMSDDGLKQMTSEFRKELGVREEDGKLINTLSIEEEQKILEKILPEVFAVVREMAKRKLEQRHYDVQLIGGMVLYKGQITEMRTGEGKTLVATLPLYLNALTGRGVHLITVNDYLSRIGAGWMAPIYYALGMTISVIVHNKALIYDPEHLDENQFDARLQQFKEIPRKQAYNCDITYGTNNEFGFDYLRDNMAPDYDSRVQKPLYYSIVDEVDSILIDEARTPLIISGSVQESTDKYAQFSELVKRLKENEDYNVDEKLRSSTLSEAGISKMEKWLGMENIYVTGGIKEVHHIEQALKAEVLFKRDRDYVVKEGEVIIVDEFTGRLMEGRRYSAGLHQAIEAKEGVKVRQESQTLATITFQNYFRMYEKLAGMTGTAMTEAEEFYKIYGLETISIPTHKPIVRIDANDVIYATEKEKYEAVVKGIKELQDKGQPVLVGTISIEKNEFLGDLLEREGIKANILNAKQHDKEAQFIAQAGKAGSVTIATNMAGRGVDIVLGGNPFNQEEHEKVVKLGGLHVIGTERHEARRIDNQLRGRSGRQGDPGSSQFYVSMEDDLMRIFGGDRMKNMMKALRLPPGTPVNNKIISKSIESAQKKVEGNNFDIRKHLVEYDDVISKHREAIYERRLKILEKPEDSVLSGIIMDMVEAEIEQVVSFHTAADNIKDWDIKEIYQTASTIFRVEENLQEDLSKLSGENHKLDKVKARTKIIKHLVGLAENQYAQMKDASKEAGIDWEQIERAILLRSIDSLWVEHLETMDYMRRGIGLRGYGQRDPLVEYKKEAYLLYSELNGLIQKQIVYSIFKIGGLEEIMAPGIHNQAQKYSAPAKESSDSSGFAGFKVDQDSSSSSVISQPKVKAKDESGKKVGRNDPCPCGAKNPDGTPMKYKKCCGK
ncbi:MAG: preprotein translocase subunit SecA [bacterium]